MSNTNLHRYKKGDKVRFLNDVGGGIVKRIRKDGMVLVENEDGFEFPVLPAELVLIESAKNLQSDKISASEKTANDMHVSDREDAKKVLLAFTRNGTNNAALLHLVNDTNWYFPFALYSHSDDMYHLIVQDVLEPDTKFEIGEFPDNSLDEIKHLTIQGFFTGDKMEQMSSFVQKTIKQKVTKMILSRNYEASEYFPSDALIYTVYDSDNLDLNNLEKLMHEKELQETIDKEKSNRSQKRPDPVVWEEDLHINVLVDSVVGMSNTEILNFQMDHFRKILDKAIVEKISQVVFIHGIGNGTLKTTLRKSLEKEYHLKYEDASFKEYGFGATKVFPNQKVR